MASTSKLEVRYGPDSDDEQRHHQQPRRRTVDARSCSTSSSSSSSPFSSCSSSSSSSSHDEADDDQASSSSSSCCCSLSTATTKHFYSVYPPEANAPADALGAFTLHYCMNYPCTSETSDLFHFGLSRKANAHEQEKRKIKKRLRKANDTPVLDSSDSGTTSSDEDDDEDDEVEVTEGNLSSNKAKRHYGDRRRHHPRLHTTLRVAVVPNECELINDVSLQQQEIFASSSVLSPLLSPVTTSAETAKATNQDSKNETNPTEFDRGGNNDKLKGSHHRQKVPRHHRHAYTSALSTKTDVVNFPQHSSSTLATPTAENSIFNSFRWWESTRFVPLGMLREKYFDMPSSRLCQNSGFASSDEKFHRHGVNKEKQEAQSSIDKNNNNDNNNSNRNNRVMATASEKRRHPTTLRAPYLCCSVCSMPMMWPTGYEPSVSSGGNQLRFKSIVVVTHLEGLQGKPLTDFRLAFGLV